MQLQDVEGLFRDAIASIPNARPGRYALYVSPELYVAYDSHMQRASGGAVAFPLMFGSFTICANVEASMGTTILEKRSVISRHCRPMKRQ